MKLQAKQQIDGNKGVALNAHFSLRKAMKPYRGCYHSHTQTYAHGNHMFFRNYYLNIVARRIANKLARVKRRINRLWRQK